MIISIKSIAIERAKRRDARIRQLEQERDRREAAIMQKAPRLAEIKAIQAEIGIDLARLALRQPTKFRLPFDDLRTWSLQLRAERDELLQRLGFSPADLEVYWDCPDCQNTGWLPPEIAEGGAVRPAEKCHCLIQEEIDDLYRASGLSGSLREHLFERFSLSVYPPIDRDHMAKVLAECQEFARRVVQRTQQESLLLCGDVGRGKTFLASAIGNVAVEGGRSVVYFTFSEFLDLLRLMKFEDDADYREGIQRLFDADLIILDDLGAEKVTEFVAQELFNLINHRMNRSLPMVVSSNLKPPQIEEVYGQRISSRLLNGFEVAFLKGDDVRKVLKSRRLAL